ncbi:MAG: hypothetical protein JSS44_01895 [Proteobacteria bacterium]|nr:hypothetical protein [Pseudomonadota bacterium]MBS0462807.1 hypothetical protein [Pseudomonadota bacterium]MBS0465029.1 hypothetical protein [Pseudomonadota bacterium]
MPRTLAVVTLTGLLAACGGKSIDTSTVSQSLPLPPENSAAAPSSDASVASSGVAPAPAATTASTPIPAATDEIWKALDKRSADLQKAIDAGAWKDVTGSADAIRDLTAALPGHASKLAADAQTELQQQVTLIGTYAGKLDDAAKAGDAAAAKANFKKLNDTLGGITRFP